MIDPYFLHHRFGGITAAELGRKNRTPGTDSDKIHETTQARIHSDNIQQHQHHHESKQDMLRQ